MKAPLLDDIFNAEEVKTVAAAAMNVFLMNPEKLLCDYVSAEIQFHPPLANLIVDMSGIEDVKINTVFWFKIQI